MPRRNTTPPPTSPALSQLQILRNKFKRLKEIKAELSGFKTKYQEHDALLAELLPLFIEQDADKFVINREITLGTKKYRITPHFYDEQKGIVVPKTWKSTAFPTASIE